MRSMKVKNISAEMVMIAGAATLSGYWVPWQSWPLVQRGNTLSPCGLHGQVSPRPSSR